MSDNSVSFKITLSSLEKLVKSNKILSYLSANLTKSYFIIEGNTATLYFYGNKSIMQLPLTLENPITTRHNLSLDAGKMISAIKKMGGLAAVRLSIKASPSTLTISSDNSTDKIVLSVVSYALDAPEITAAMNFISNRTKDFVKYSEISPNALFYDFLQITSSYMSINLRNNSIGVSENRMIYSDRTIVVSLNASFTKKVETDGGIVKLHRFVLGFLDLVALDTQSFKINPANTLFSWESKSLPGFKAILAIETCNLLIPTEDETKQITPTEDYQISVDLTPKALDDAIDFFSGLFEAAIWKPIKFTWKNIDSEDKLVLSYQHPSTIVEKELIGSFSGSLNSMATEFTLISDSIRMLLSKLSEDGNIRLTFNDLDTYEVNGMGVHLGFFGDPKDSTPLYEAIFAKLEDS